MKADRRKVGVVSGSRADYGLLRPVMREILNRPSLEFQFYVTGSHLSSHHEATLADFLADGFSPSATVHMLLHSDSREAVAKSVGLGVIGFADAFSRLQPDVVLCLGDRFEMFAAAQAAFLLNIPLAHVHGGEITEGAMDDALRHAMTKLSHIHFVSHEAHRNRVVQMGEEPSRVVVTGAPGLDAIRQTPLMSKEELEAALGEFRFGPVNVILTYHPETICDRPPASQVDEVTAALDEVPEAHVIVTGTNADPGNVQVRRKLERWTAERSERATLVPSLGSRKYLSALACVDAMVGNSSSGIIEAPSFCLPTVNVGSRQQGRLRPRSVIDCDCERGAIATALKRAIKPEFRRSLTGYENPYGDGHSAPRIVSVLEQVCLHGVLGKRFRDLSDFQRS